MGSLQATGLPVRAGGFRQNACIREVLGRSGLTEPFSLLLTCVVRQCDYLERSFVTWGLAKLCPRRPDSTYFFRARSPKRGCLV